MERQGHLHGLGSYCRAWATQSPQEKQGKPGGDHSIVEELLDFSEVMEEDAGMAAHGDSVLEAGRGNCYANSSIVTAVDSSTKFFSGGSDSRSSEELICQSLAYAGLSDDLCEPFGDLEELEWLSNFVEDSFSSEEFHKQQLISGIKTTASQPTCQPNYPFAAVAASGYESPPFTPESPLPGKARSKRVRNVPDSWSMHHLLVAPTTESSSSDYSDPNFAQPNPVKQPTKKEPSPSVDGRRCLHCATDKTPQWRAGPLGPKTLCNACGVRYKSGRLVPEYRPAASPTFVISKHSNSHRKVLELRRQKEIHQQQFLPAYDTAMASAAVVAAADDFLIHHHQHHPDYRSVF